MDITKIYEDDRKCIITDEILHSIPEWFGIEESIQEYIKNSRQSQMWAYIKEGEPIGFLSAILHNPYTAEVTVMGIKKEYHRKGIGRVLMECAFDWACSEGCEYFEVKTLDSSARSKEYDRTRRFYYDMGFRPLECLKEYWDKSNPCLIMVKYIGK